MSKSLIAVAVAAVAALALARPALAGDDAMRDLTMEQMTAVQTGKADAGDVRVSTWFDRANPIYATGERVRIFVRADRNAHVAVFDIGPTGEVTQLFPNAFQPDDLVRAGKALEVGSGGRITVTGPVGAELIKIVVSEKPLPFLTDADLGGRSTAFPALRGGVSALLRNLAVAPQSGDADLTIIDRAFRTMSSRHATIVPSALSATLAQAISETALAVDGPTVQP